MKAMESSRRDLKSSGKPLAAMGRTDERRL